MEGACVGPAECLLVALVGCYTSLSGSGEENVKRVNLVEYFDLAEALHRAKQATSEKTNSGILLYVALMGVPDKLKTFAADDNGFRTCKHSAEQLADCIENWLAENVQGSFREFDPEKLENEFSSWQYAEISRKIDAFKSVFEAECRDVDVYSVSQIGIYRTSALVSEADKLIPEQFHKLLPGGTEDEFRNAGKCLAFDLPTACGFHALRGLELVMDAYITSFGVDTKSLRSWSDYIKSAQSLIERGEGERKPSARVTAMLDRMRQLDRNPLMHPRETVDTVSADQLFRLCAATVVEMVKDMTGAVPVPSNESSNVVEAPK